MEIHQVRYFLAVCQTMNFTRAAEQCNVSQPALTRAIKKLEDELRGPLFRRERNRTHLTDLGQLMKPYLERSLRDLEAAKDVAADFHALERAPVNLGIMCTIGPARLVGLLSKIAHDYPGIELSLHEATPAELIEKMMKGDLDIALIGLPVPLPVQFDTHFLFRERFVIAFPPGHRFEALNSIRLEEMADESYLSRINCEFADHIDGLLAERNVELNIRYRSEREDWVQCMILAGMGCAFMPEFLPLFPGLPTRSVLEPEIARNVELATVSGRRHSRAVITFTRLAIAHDWTVESANS